MISFRLLGISIHVQPFFWLIMAFIGGGGILLSHPTTEALVHTLVFMAAGFISIVIHEMGHALMMRKYGRIPQIILHGYGGVAISTGSPFTRFQSFLVSISGPALQASLGVIALLILKTVGAETFPTDQSQKFVINLMNVSFYWALINLIPIHPLDGGQILEAVLGPKRRKAVHYIGITIGIIALIFMIKIGASLFGLIIVGYLTYNNFKALNR